MRVCDRMLMSCQCFAEMLINFRFGKILALRKSHFWQRSCQNFLFKIKGSNLSIFVYIVQAIMIRMSSRVVDRYLAAATEDMIKNEEIEIKCPCRKCKQKYLLNPFNGILKGHLLANGFMYGYTHWVFSEDDEEV